MCLHRTAFGQHQQVGQVRQRKHHGHEAPVQGADRAQEVLGLALQHHAHGHEQEAPHRDEHQEHVVPGLTDPPVLQRHGQIHPEQHAAVGTARGNQRQVFLQREEGQEGEEADGDVAPDGDRHGEDRHHPPPGLHARGQLRVFAGAVAAAHQPHDDRGQAEQAEDAAEDPLHLHRHPQIGDPLRHWAISRRAWRARLMMVRAARMTASHSSQWSHAPAARPRPSSRPSRPNRKARSLLPSGPS